MDFIVNLAYRLYDLYFYFLIPPVLYMILRIFYYSNIKDNEAFYSNEMNAKGARFYEYLFDYKEKQLFHFIKSRFNLYSYGIEEERDLAEIEAYKEKRKNEKNNWEVFFYEEFS